MVIKRIHLVIAALLIVIIILSNQIFIHKKRVKRLQHTLTQEKIKPILKVKLINCLPGASPYTVMWISSILQEKYHIHAVEKNFDLIISMNYGKEDIEQIDFQHKAIRVFITPEAVTPNLVKYDLAIGFDYIENEKYLRMPFYYVAGNLISTKFKRGKCNPNKENFACFLVTNSGLPDKNGHRYWHNAYDLDGCAARNSLFHNLSKYKQVTSGGKYLNNIGKIISFEETNDWLSTCKFIFAYENQSFPGYITEKPFQAYINGAIPLYYADQSVLTDINPKSVIFAKDFANEEKLIDYIKQVDNDDELYCKIWNEPMMVDPEKDFTVMNDKLRVKLNKLLDKKFNKANLN